jgi:hypothetical protein
MTTLKNYFDLPPAIRLRAGKEVLGHVHSGNVMTHSLPRFLRAGAVLWFIAYTLQWLVVWLGVYENYERWGLMQAFFAQMISIIAAFIVVSVTLLRARHLETLPGDDFVFLRMSAVFFRWMGEVALILAIGAFLSSLLSSVSLPLLFLSASGATPQSFLGLGLKIVAAFALIASFLQFVLLYTIATGIELMLAIEFNTRTERIAKASHLAESGPR